jgi:hypothetical protein
MEVVYADIVSKELVRVILGWAELSCKELNWAEFNCLDETRLG